VQGAAEGRRALRADFAPSRELAEAGLNITSVRARVGALAEIIKVVPLSVPPGESAQGGLVFALFLVTAARDEEVAAAMGIDAATIRELIVPPAPEVASDTAPPESEVPEVDVRRQGVVRVDVTRLDDAMERLSALVVNRFRLERAVLALSQRGVDVREVREILNDNARQLRDLRASILRVRMVRVAELFERIPLLVRGLARTTGKQVRLEIDAGQAELDKAVAERIFPALVHLVRNAVDHAIETPEERTRAGKPEEGSLSIACFERSNTQLEITITDDGRGVDRERVAQRAGRAVPESDAGLLELLCLPGLSTREEATTTSGRGMGMDIVKRVIVDELGGELLMQTRAGAGTRFVMHVPLTISIVDAFSFECSNRRFVVPVRMVEEILEVDPAKLVRAPAGVGRNARAVRMLERRGETVPFVELEVVFGLGARTDGLRKALLVRRNNEPIAFAVDRMLGQQEVVVRPLEDPLVKVPGVAGATDLGDGRAVLILDLPALLRHRAPSRRRSMEAAS
jgi:two-component system chemotaxis sensor kinase CheA